MSLSIESAVRTCKINTAWANRIESDRFFNPSAMVCPVWTGVDSAGRRVCPDSFMTKTAGCNSAEDRVLVENDQRPQYMEYINLSANGFGEDLYGNTMPWNANKNAEANLKYGEKNIHGGFGQDWRANVYPSCGYNSYKTAMAQEQKALREQGALNEGFKSNFYRQSSGF